MAGSSVLDLIGSSSDKAKFEVGYYQAQVTAVDATTGQVYIQQLDNEDNLPDEAPYTALRGFVPAVGEWVWVARWGRTSVVIGPLNREDTILPKFFKTPGGPAIAWGTDPPNGDPAYSLPIGSIFLQTTGNPTRSSAFLFVKTTDSSTSYGWVSPHDAPRTRSRRQLLVYPGASLISSYMRSGFADDPTITAATHANADASSGAFLQHSTSAVLNNIASLVAGSNSVTQLQWTPMTVMAIRTGSIVTLQRQWWGLFSATPAGSADPTISAIGFRFDTSVSDVNMMAYTNDGTSGGTITDTGVSVSAGLALELRIDAQDSYVDFFISGNWVARHTTDLPVASTNLSFGIYLNTLGANVRNLRWGRITMESEP